MSSNSIVTRLGAYDIEVVAPARSDAHVTEINFIDGYDRLDFGLGQALDQLNVLGLVPSERGVASENGK